MNKKSQRDVIFISHATPGDNAFSIWLASRLGLAGYNVWCDQEQLLGGEDFWKDIERTIRNRCIKMVLVVSKNVFDENGELRDGISKEVALADILKKSLGDERFLIPVRIDDVNFSDFSVEFVRLNGIDCKDNWSKVLHQLLKVFERDELPKKTEPHHSIKAWQSLQQNLARNISEKPEKLQTNWLPITAKPEQLNFFEIKRTVEPNEVRSIASEVLLPCSDHGRLLVTYAEENELQSQLGQHTPIGFRGSLRTDDFLRGVTGDILGISPFDASNKITSIYRQAWSNLCSSKGLISYELANGILAWWFPEDLIEDGNLRFTDFNGKPRRRPFKVTKGQLSMMMETKPSDIIGIWVTQRNFSSATNLAWYFKQELSFQRMGKTLLKIRRG